MGIRLIERLLSRRPVMALTAMAAAVFVLAAMLVARKHEAASELADAQRLPSWRSCRRVPRTNCKASAA